MGNDEILSLILSKLETLEQGQNELRTEVQSVKDEVQTIKLDITRLEQGQNEMKADMQTVKKDVQMVKHDVKEISWKVDILYDWVDSVDNKVRNIDERTA